MSDPVKKSADLFVLIPPAASAWSFFGVQDLEEPFIQVRDGEGTYALGWSLMGDTHQLRIKFTLYRQDALDLTAIKEMAIPAQPAFSVFHQMTRGLVDQEKNIVPVPHQSFASVAGDLPAHNEVMDEQHDQLHELLQDWFEDSPELDILAGNLYVALSTDVSMQLTQPGWTPPRLK